ncbi:MAG: hypothetical protein FWD17_03725 [Polyangiaceae bacterium]|nr:hypothetical protein [Polyangiaceae bacterium]
MSIALGASAHEALTQAAEFGVSVLEEKQTCRTVGQHGRAGSAAGITVSTGYTPFVRPLQRPALPIYRWLIGSGISRQGAVGMA